MNEDLRHRPHSLGTGSSPAGGEMPPPPSTEPTVAYIGVGVTSSTSSRANSWRAHTTARATTGTGPPSEKQAQPRPVCPHPTPALLERKRPLMCASEIRASSCFFSPRRTTPLRSPSVAVVVGVWRRRRVGRVLCRSGAGMREGGAKVVAVRDEDATFTCRLVQHLVEMVGGWLSVGRLRRRSQEKKCSGCWPLLKGRRDSGVGRWELWQVIAMLGALA